MAEIETAIKKQSYKLMLLDECPDYVGEINVLRFQEHQEKLMTIFDLSFFEGLSLTQKEIIRCPPISKTKGRARNVGEFIGLMIKQPHTATDTDLVFLDKIPPSYVITIYKILKQLQSAHTKLVFEKLIQQNERMTLLFSNFSAQQQHATL